MGKQLYTLRGDILPAREKLAQMFPGAFMRRGEQPKKPLKIGIDKDVIAVVKDMPRALIKAAIADYCKGTKYTRAMIAGSVRVDLEGNPAGEVTPDSEAFAKAKQERLDEKTRDYHRQMRKRPAAVEVMA